MSRGLASLVLFASILAAQLALVGQGPFFPLQDGPIHLHNASVWFDYDSPELGVYRDHYVRNLKLSPNWTVQLALGLMMKVVSARLAERLVVGLIVVAVPLALAFALSAIRRDAAWLAVWLTPFTLGPLLYTGLLNFCLGLALWMVAVGCWLRFPPAPSLWARLGLSAILVVLYFTHIVTLGFAIVTLLGLALVRAASSAEDGGSQRWRELLSLLAVMAPALALAGGFFVEKSEDAPAHFGLPWQRAWELASMRHFASFDFLERWLAGAVMGCLAILGLLGKRDLSARSRWLFVGFLLLLAAFFIGFLLSPQRSSGGSRIEARFPIGMVLIGILMLGCLRYPVRTRWIGSIAAAALAFAQLAVVWPHHREQIFRVAEYASCDPELPLRSTVLPIRLNRLHPLLEYPGSYFVDAAANASGWTAVDRLGVTLRNFTAYDGHHPIDYRAHLRPLDTLGCAECGQPIVLANFERAGSRVDAVYLWGTDQQLTGWRFWPMLEQQLDRGGYELVCRSIPFGLGRLYLTGP